MRFPLMGGEGLTPTFAPSDLVFLAVFLRALERLGMGLSRGDFAAIAAVVVFCSASGIGALAPVRSALMVGCVLALRWRRLKADPDSVGPALAFGLTLAGVLALLTCAASVGERFWRR